MDLEQRRYQRYRNRQARVIPPPKRKRKRAGPRKREYLRSQLQLEYLKGMFARGSEMHTEQPSRRTPGKDTKGR